PDLRRRRPRCRGRPRGPPAGRGRQPRLEPPKGHGMTTSPLNRIAGPPISWGVCEVPGWGHQLTPQRVLNEMREVGLAAPELDADGWQLLLSNLDRLASLAAERGVRAVLHPHVGTMIENGDEVRRVLEHSAISLCLDTGHLLIGGTDPAELTRQAPERIAHTHFKDVNGQIAAQVRSGRLSYTEGVSRGMYRPLGRGDVAFAPIRSPLGGRGFGGWV